MPVISHQETKENAILLLNNAIELYAESKYTQASKKLEQAHKIFLAYKDISSVSICFSLESLIKYLNKDINYYKALLLCEDSKFLCESTNNDEAKAVNNFVFGRVYFYEGKQENALSYFSSAIQALYNVPILQTKAYEYCALISLKIATVQNAYGYIQQAKKTSDKTNSKYLNTEINELLKSISTSLSIPNNRQHDTNIDLLHAFVEIAKNVNDKESLDNLLVTITEQTKKLLNAEICHIFLYDNDKNELYSEITTLTENINIRFSADKGLAGYVHKNGQPVNIKNADSDYRYNNEIAKILNYKVKNILCMPVRNIKFEIIGVFEVINKKTSDFTTADEEILFAIGTNAGIAIENNLLFKVQQRMLKEQKQLFEEFTNTLAVSIDTKDKITKGHSDRVLLYAKLICDKLGLNPEITNVIIKAARLHDIGKIGIKDDILQKKGMLTTDEYSHIKEHVKYTYDILKQTSVNSLFSEITEIAASHHERYDGTGYFRGLKGEQIPLGGRILAVSDVFDAITSDRHYRNKMPIQEALNIMLEGKNSHFDGKIIDVFFSLSCAEVLLLMLEETNTKIKFEDLRILKKYTLNDFSKILNSRNYENNNIELVQIFNSYYDSKKTSRINV